MADSFQNIVQKGDRGKDVRLAQEWLSFHGCATAVDGIFGAATEASTRNFQTGKGIAVSGAVDAPTQQALLAPIDAVQQPIAPAGQPLAALYVAYARQHLQQRPIEIGGENCGPWVRLYMKGKEGVAWPWCAGFATWVLNQAARTLGVTAPHPYAVGCDFLAVTAQAKGSFLSPRKPADNALVQPGYLFLVRRTSNDWSHIGIVEAVNGETMTTIEGNTNDNGSREGYEVCRRTRALAGKDFLMV